MAISIWENRSLRKESSSFSRLSVCYQWQMYTISQWLLFCSVDTFHTCMNSWLAKSPWYKTSLDHDYAKSRTAQDGLISCAGVTREWWLLSLIPRLSITISTVQKSPAFPLAWCSTVVKVSCLQMFSLSSFGKASALCFEIAEHAAPCKQVQKIPVTSPWLQAPATL